MKVINNNGSVDRRTYFGRTIKISKRDWSIYFAWAYTDDTMTTVARMYHISTERVRQIVTRIEYLVATKRIEIPAEPEETTNE